MTHHCVHEWGIVPVNGGAGGKAFSVREADALVAAAQAHPLGGSDGSGIITDRRHYLKAGQMVGVLAAAGCTLEILPKIDSGSADEDVPTLRARLVSLIDLALDLRIGEGEAALMARRAESLLDVLIRLFADRLLTEARRGLPRRYIDREDDLPALRGRLDVTRQFTFNAVRPDRLASHFDELSCDIPLMQIMAATIVSLRQRTRSAEAARLLDELRFAFDAVTLLPPRRLQWDKAHIARGERRWEVLLRLARLLLGQDWQGTRHGTEAHGEGHSLLFPMNALFEKAVATLLRCALAGTDVSVHEQSGRTACLWDWDQWQGGQPPQGHRFQTKPDILLRKNGRVIGIIDTKWKHAEDGADPKSGVGQADVYQMMAYARLYECDRLMLLFPAKPGEISGTTHRFGLHGGQEMLAISKLDIAQDRRATIEALAFLHEFCGTTRTGQASPI